MSSMLSAMNAALMHPSLVSSRVTSDIMISDDNNVTSSLDANCNCSAVAAAAETSQNRYSISKQKQRRDNIIMVIVAVISSIK